ncbi:hypothetical protein [Pseudomonas lopnurensis]|uniref:hypothetical protein n=1 Tax=Pseudomonas lopnurensis TaxID=1477517 RepID=UPI0028A5D332|nr:hypothetical protein [Pseudomonas lopnurensis]
MTYLSEMNEAIARASRLGLKTPNFQLMEGQLLNQKVYQDIPYIVRDAMGDASLEEVAAQCLSYHMRLLPILNDYFGTELTYTIGHVAVGSKIYFEQTEDQMQALIKSGVTQPQLSIHAWLTLPTCEILDFTLPTTFAMLSKTKEGYGSVLSGHADRLLNDVSYHPMLLGEDYLRRIGALVEFEYFL